MLRPSLFLCSTTQSMAAITWAMWVSPVAPATLTETMRASGAIPLNPSAVPSLPAMMPAMWVPWPLRSSAALLPLPE